MNISLNLTDFLFLSPLLILTFGALLILLIECFVLNAKGKIPFVVTLVTLGSAFIAANTAPQSDNRLLTAWLKTDELSIFFTEFFLIIGFVSALLAESFFKKFDETDGEYYFLLIASTFGLILIGASADFLTLFLGLETLSISLYILCGYVKKWKISHEAAIKYFLIGSLGTAFVLYGIALIYGALGTTNFDALMPDYLQLSGNYEKTLFFSGAALVTLGLLFKATIVPFHSWAPDVYEGASTPVTAFMAVGTKIGAFAAFIRIFLEGLPNFDTAWNESLCLLFFPTLIYGNFVALRQVNLRRFFAYSGIVHSGYLLIPLSSSSKESIPSILFYLAVYAIATFGSFAVLSILDKEKRGLYMDDLSGLFTKSPFLASVLTLSLLTLAGIPPTVGFFAKFYIFKVGFDAGYYALVIAGLLMTVFSAFYYLRIITKMLIDDPEKHPVDANVVKNNLSSSLVGAMSLAAILIFSVFPGLLFNLVT